jgi:endonuclease/exonuclease/phosphatase family metal-dependent hydrolase
MPAAPSPERSEKPKHRPSLWHLPIWWANGISVLVLLASYLAPHVSPSAFWPLAIMAFGFPFLLLLHAFFLFYWLLFRRKRMLLSGIALLIGSGHIGDHVRLFGSSERPAGITSDGVKLLSWNVRLFDLYSWGQHPKVRDRIFEVLRREDAGILCLQEVFHSDNNRIFRTRDEIVQDMGYKEHLGWASSAHREHFGVATFTKHRITGKGRVAFGRRTGNICIWTDILLGADTVRVYNAHLASYHFGRVDYRLIEGLDAEPKADSLKQGGLRILKRLREGAIRRADEVARIAADMEQSPHPVIFCGDLNDVPLSYAYRRLRGERCDAFVESGTGLGGTYIGNLPKLRIDHILHDAAIASWGFQRLPDELSDHHANAVMIAVRGQQ